MSEEGIPGSIASKVEALGRLKENQTHIGVHNSLFLLKNCFLLPKMLYTLRTAPTWRSLDSLEGFDQIQREILESTLNINLGEDAWKQATLPVRSGGLGVRRAVDLAVPAYYSSQHLSASLAAEILPDTLELNTELEGVASSLWALSR